MTADSDYFGSDTLSCSPIGIGPILNYSSIKPVLNLVYFYVCLYVFCLYSYFIFEVTNYFSQWFIQLKKFSCLALDEVLCEMLGVRSRTQELVRDLIQSWTGSQACT